MNEQSKMRIAAY